MRVRIPPSPAAIEFFVHLSLAAGVASVNKLSSDHHHHTKSKNLTSTTNSSNGTTNPPTGPPLSQSEHHPNNNNTSSTNNPILHHRQGHVSITGARLNVPWRSLSNVEYLCDGGHTWIHTALFENHRPVVVKTLKPECQDLATAMHEMEAELTIHARLSHPHVVSLVGAGTTRHGVRFLLVERCDGGTLAQRLGYDTARIRDRRRRFWRRQPLAFEKVLQIGLELAEAMLYLHESAIPGGVVLHRDLKPDNVGLLLDGTVKLMDFGLAKILEQAGEDGEDEVYQLSGETGSLRYMAPEVADGLPYNTKADVYSFGILLWELVAGKKPFDGLDRALFYERIVHGGERPTIRSKWPPALADLLRDCWDADMQRRPSFRTVVARLTALQGESKLQPKKLLPRMVGGMVDRHSTWF